MKSVLEAATFQGFSNPPISVKALAKSFQLQMPISILKILSLANARAKIDSMTQLLSSGSAGTKFGIAVIGDGFSSGDDQIIYNKKIKDLVLKGIFSNDFFSEMKSAFNIYRINLISQDSGVGVKTYNGETLISTITKNTALGIYYNGSWSHCWLEDGPKTKDLIDNALNKFLPDYKLVLVILNNPGSGGCGGGRRATVGSSVHWATIAHEFGHAMGGLDDEYCNRLETYTEGESECSVNTTTIKDRKSLKWKSYIDSTTPIPTGIGKCTGYNQGQKPTDWDDNQSVGLFEGAKHCKQGVYRPVIDCRMNSDLPRFCPICYAHMKSMIKNRKTRDTKDVEGLSGDSSGYVRFNVHVNEGILSITDVKEVPGPFTVPINVSLGYNYEILIDDELITSDFLPDVGVRRSFINQEEIGAEGKHHISTVKDFDFFVRIPKSRVTRYALPKLTIKLHKVKKSPDRLTDTIPLIKQTGLISTEIGSLTGINLDGLPENARLNLERVMTEK